MNKALLLLFFYIFTPSGFSQTPDKSNNERIKICLNALYNDQKDFFKRNGRFAAHVDQLHNSEREACYGVILSLRRSSSKEYRITGVMGDVSGTINSSMNLTWDKNP